MGEVANASCEFAIAQLDVDKLTSGDLELPQNMPTDGAGCPQGQQGLCRARGRSGPSEWWLPQTCPKLSELQTLKLRPMFLNKHGSRTWLNQRVDHWSQCGF